MSIHICIYTQYDILHYITSYVLHTNQDLHAPGNLAGSGRGPSCIQFSGGAACLTLLVYRGCSSKVAND